MKCFMAKPYGKAKWRCLTCTGHPKAKRLLWLVASDRQRRQRRAVCCCAGNSAGRFTDNSSQGFDCGGFKERKMIYGCRIMVCDGAYDRGCSLSRVSCLCGSNKYQNTKVKKAYKRAGIESFPIREKNRNFKLGHYPQPAHWPAVTLPTMVRFPALVDAAGSNREHFGPWIVFLLPGMRPGGRLMVK